MPDLPRVFVGTMHSLEGDFQHSIERVRCQLNVTVTHFIVSGLKEKEAHNALWAAWRQQRDSQDLFVKVDADTVLASTTTLAEIYAVFRQDARVTGLQAPLNDYMTAGFINGLNAFSPVVSFNDTRDELYCDRQVDTGHNVVIRNERLPESLVPAGYHCHYSNDKQAFHYGLHRMLKGQRDTMDKVTDAWTANGKDRIRGLAIIGSQMAGRFLSNRRFNYADPEFLTAFEEAEKRYDEFTDHIALGRFDRVC